MILYYTGTGNSEYVAKRIANQLQEETINLFDVLLNHDYSEIYSEKPFIIVCPTYGWQIPHILRDWLEKVTLTGTKDIYFVMTCGSDIADSKKYIKKLCDKKQMNFKGCAEIIMPENYVALFPVPDENEAKDIIKKANPVIDYAVKQILNKEDISNTRINCIDYIKSSLVNAVFYPVIVHAKKFYVKDTCIHCGKCANVCVMNNIQMVEHKPEWGSNCTHCMACICGCPTEAIEYGNASKNKTRYQCPKDV